MKKKFIDVCTLCLITLCIVGIPMFNILRVYADPNDISTCTNPTGCVYSTGDSDIKQNPPTKYSYDCVGHAYCEPKKAATYAELNVTSYASNTTTKVSLYENEEELRIAKERGNCNDVICDTGANWGLTGLRDTWGDQIKQIGKEESANGNSFEYNNQYSLNKAKIVLEEAGFDTSKMSDADIAAEATKIAKETGGFSSSEFKLTTHVIDQATGRMLTCPGDSDCDKVAADGFAADAIKDMTNGKASTDDSGALCADGKCPDIPEEGDEDEPKTPSLPNYEIDVGSCSPVFADIPQPESIEIPENEFSGGSCGSTAINIVYTGIPVACGKAVMLQTVATTAKLPSVQSTVYAGKGFNWGVVSSTTNISTILYDDGQLRWEQEVSENKIAAYEAAISCLEQQLTDLTNEYNNDYTILSNIADSNYDDAQSCDNGDYDYFDDSDCKYCEEGDDSCFNTCGNWVYADCTPYWSAYDASVQALVDLTDNYEKAKEGLIKQIEGYRDDLEKEKKIKTELDECEASIPKDSASTSYGTVELINETMQLGKYTQEIDSVKGVHKNSGELLTLKDIKNIDKNIFLEVNTDFFVPYYVNNNMSGKVSGTITGGIKISNYSCPITTKNYVMCTDNDCDSNYNIIYRPISLTNAFPTVTTNEKYRQMGSNWNKLYAERYIENNRGVSDYDIYNMTPLYTITLTPDIIKEIRKYNKNNSYGDFNMKCVDGYKCMSEFLWNSEFTSIINQANSCASSSGWNSDCYYGGASE